MKIQTATPRPGDETAANLMRDALVAARGGRPEDACELAEQALAAGGDPIPINALLGMARLDLGETERAVEHLEYVHERRPTDIRIATDLAAALTSVEQFDRTLEVASRELALADPTLQLARVRGAVAVQLRNFEAAAEALNHVLAAMPTDWESWNNLGNALSMAEDFEGSASAFERALSINPRSAEMRMNYATALRELGRMDDAEAVLRDLAAEFPDNPLPFRELHLLLKEASRDQDALEAIEAAVQLRPDNVDLLLDKASHLAALQKMNDAEATYRQVLAIDPFNTTAFVGIALVHELLNRPGELAQLADDAAVRGVDSAANFIRAVHHYRKKEFDAGLATLQGVPADVEPARQLHLRGQLLEGAGRYDEAFGAFAEMNAFFRADASHPELRAENYRDTIRTFRKIATDEWARGWRAEETPYTGASPVFLVGFPRSGTTLLDTILMGHPQVEVMEEEPALRNAMELLPLFGELPTLTDEEIRAARDVYLKTAASITPLAHGKLLIDKNPLTMNLLPFARRLFPQARIILALRHPFDVVLSCFMANFRLNDGMASFLRLDTAAELYDLSFDYFEHVQRLMPLPMHTVLYENVVADRERELRALFDFLGLDWHDSALAHETTALKRGRIKTASYAQVVEPIYTRSAGRWEKYRKHLEPVLPVLKPWAEKFGYTI